MIIVVMMSGCSDKSNAELVDVEQFRCQDSIETVFEVLGEVQIKEEETLSGSNYYYEYEDVILWGKRGKLTFYVRNDKDTIKYFAGNITSDDSEGLVLLSSFTDKYGSYEIENIMNVNKNYVWKIANANGEVGYRDGEIGFDKLVISIKGVYDEESEHKLTFSDEWSYVTDEAYFEALEESQNLGNDNVIIDRKECEYDGVKMNLTFSVEGEGQSSFAISLYVEEKWKAAGIYTYTKTFVNVLNEELNDKGITSTVVMLCNGDLISNVVSYSENNGNVELIDVTEWLLEGMQDEHFDADECGKLWKQMEADIYPFVFGDDYATYMNN